jgi:glycosyltransferase involved in cell wall biosynthesis
VLAQKSLLILPSLYDPFPVSVLEALSVGTPVLVNPSCGFSDILKSYDLRYVADKDSESSLYSAFLSFYNKPVSFQERLEIQEFTKMNFSIREVVERLVQIYGNKNTKIS